MQPNCFSIIYIKSSFDRAPRSQVGGGAPARGGVLHAPQARGLSVLQQPQRDNLFVMQKRR